MVGQLSKIRLNARALLLGSLLFALLALGLGVPSAPSYADSIWHNTDDTVDNTQHVTTIYASRVLASMPTDYNEFHVAYTYVTRMYCEGAEYSNTDSSIGHLWFDITIPACEWLGNTSPISLEHSVMCIDRNLAAPGGSSGSAQGWPISWTGEKPYGELRARLVSTNASTGTATYVLTFSPTDSAGHSYQWLGYQRLQTQPYLYVVFPTEATLSLTKASANPSCTNGNSLYSLAGTTYGLYASSADASTDTNRIFTFTSDAAGNCGTATITVTGTTTYYVKELTVGPGYMLDPAVHSVSVAPGANTFTVADNPKLDPPYMNKAVSGEAGGTTLSGIQWTLSFYPGIYYDTASAAQAATAQYTWVFQSDSDGYASYREAYKVSGPTILADSEGIPGLPLGTVVITETSTNDSLRLTDTTPRLIWITEDEGAVWKEGSSTWTNAPKTGFLEVQKTLVNSVGGPADVSKAAGIQVQIKSATTGQVVETLTLDSNGYAKSGELVYDTYQCVEVVSSVPSNIEPWYVTNGVSADTPFATAHVGDTDGATVRVSFTDKLTTQTVELWKQPSDAQLAATSSIYADYTGCTYGLYDTAEHAAARGDDGRFFTFHCDASGHTEKTGELECGQTLYVVELTAPASGAFKLSDEVVAIELTGATTTFEISEELYSGTIALEKHDSVTGSADPQGDATFAGMEVAVRYWPVFASSIDELSAEPESTFTLTTGADGTVTSGVLAAGSYVLQESAAPNGYLLSDTSEHLVVIDATGVHYLSDAGATVIFADAPITATISVEKTLLNAGGSEADASRLAGIQIAVKDTAGAVVDTITLDETGKGTSVALPIGTYTLTELAFSVPAGVLPYAWTAEGSTEDIAFATVEITTADNGAVMETSLTDYTAPSQVVHKTDIDTGEGLQGAKITLYRAPDGAFSIADGVVTVSDSFDGSSLSDWVKVGDLTTDAEGYVGWSMLSFGLYAIAETSSFVTPDGDVYLDEARSLDVDAAAPIIHRVVFDKDHESRAITIADKRVDIAVVCTERTIAVTSAALDATEQEYGVSNVSTEGQYYFISAANNSSVDTQNFVIKFDFDDIRAHGGKVITVCTPTTTGDKDGSAVLYYATTDAPGTWVKWADVSATSPARFEVSSLGAELAGVKLDYGDVTKDMTVGTQYSPANSDDLAFEIVYTRALDPADSPVILHGCDVRTDLAVSSSTLIFAEDEDSVETRVILPKTMRTHFEPNTGLNLIGTGDMDLALLAGIICLGILSVIYLASRRSRKLSARIALGAITIGASLALLPALALAEPAVIEKDYTWMEGEDAPAIPETITVGGVTYNLVSKTEAAFDPSFTPEERTFTGTGSGNYATLEQAHEYLPDTMAVDEDGFTGEIPQTSFDVKEITGSLTTVTDVEKSFGPFPTNDVTQLEGLVDLEYSAPTWTVVETNSVGIPTSYMATVITKEASVSTVHTGYAVTATYEGTLVKDEQRLIVTATYEGPDSDAVATAPEPEPAPAPEAKNGLSAGAIAGIAGGAAAAASALGFLILRRRNVIVRDYADSCQIGKATGKDRGDRIEIRVPAKISLNEGARLILPESLAEATAAKVTWQGTTYEKKVSEKTIVFAPADMGR